MATVSIDVYIKLPSGKAFSSQHLPSDTVRKIAEFVGKKEGVPEKRVRIKYQGKTLDKSKTVGYLGICAETILKAEVVFPKELHIFINFPDGTCNPFIVQTTDDIQDLKRKIEVDSGISSGSQILQLENGSTVTRTTGLLCDAGIVNESVLTVKERVTTPASNNGNENVAEEEIDEGKKQELIDSFATEGKNIEVVFCFDTTGSMYSCLDQVRTKLRQSCERLVRDIPNIRIGIMAHGDYCDHSTYILRYIDLTADVDNLVDFATNVPATGGGDSPECYEWALRKAQQLDWSEDSAKALVMIGDELPHIASYTDQNLFWKDELDVLAGMGIKVYGVQALHQASSNLFYQEMAERTGGYYLRLNNFSLITDMFLAVCYRESNAEQLDAFVEEVRNEGRMTEDTKLFLDKLEKEPPKMDNKTVEERQRRYISAAWWDRSLDGGRPQYEYREDLDSFRPISYSSRAIPIPPASPLPSPGHACGSRAKRFVRFFTSAFKRK